MNQPELSYGSVNHINQLNDDCMVHIFSYLSIAERIRVQRVCKRWKLISQLAWRTVKVFNFKESFWGIDAAQPRPKYDRPKMKISLRDPRLVKILEKFEKYVTRVDLSRDYWCYEFDIDTYKFVVSRIAKFCPNVKVLDLGKSLSDPDGIVEWTLNCISDNFRNLTTLLVTHLEKFDAMKNILSSNKNLKNLVLSRCKVDSFCLEHLNYKTCEGLYVYICSFNEKTLKHFASILRRTKVLHTFRYSSGDCQESSLLQSIAFNSSSLKELYLSSVQFNSCKDPEYFKSLINLETLTLDGNKSITDEFLNAIGYHCIKLKKLNIRGEIFVKVRELIDIGLESISKSPELKYLSLGMVNITDIGLSALANSPKLEELDLFLAKTITDKPFSEMTNLRKFNISACDNIKSDGLSELLETSTRIEYLGMRIYNQRQEALKIIDAGIKTKSKKLIITIEGELHIDDKCEGAYKYTMSKLDGQITRKKIHKFCTRSVDTTECECERRKMIYKCSDTTKIIKIS